MPPRSRNKQQHGNRPRSTSLHVNVSADTVDNQQTTNQPEVAGGRRREIPDSQEDPADYDFSDSNEDELLAEESIEEYSTDEEEASEAENIRKAILAWWLDHIDTTAAPAPAPAPNSQPPYTLRATGLNCNGRLAAEHSEVKNMEETATQPATQPQFDTRRDGNNSISEDDAADVICILHPSSKAAHQAVELVVKLCPQHILQNQGLEYLLEYDTDDQDPAGSTRPDAGSQDSQVEEDDTQELASEATTRPEAAAKDIALRLSSKVHNQCLGFTFGRNPQKCDIPIAAKNEHMKLSNMHFRIYVNSSGSLMCEDTSTNGTWVDGFELRAKSNDPEFQARRTIVAGSMIWLFPNGPQEPIRFIVGIPPRDRQEALYGANLAQYRATVEQLERQATLAAQAAANGNAMPPPPLFALGQHQHSAARASIPARTFAASTMPFNHGMTWNGGNTYNVVAHIGKGAFANVYKLSTKANGDLVAAKEIEKRKYLKDGILDSKVHNEIEIMQKVNHEHIVQYLGYHETSAHLYVLMEYVPYGDLTPFVSRKNLLTERQCQSVAYQTMHALDYLHKNKITHRDIKPDNILIASSDPMVVKLSDFGLSKVVTNDDTFLKTFCGTLLYCAPEIYPGYENVKNGKPVGKRGRGELQLQTLPYQQSVDTWAFAAVIYHLLCGIPPYSVSNDHKGQQMLECVMSKPANWDRLKQAGISPEGCDFVKRMLVHEPGARASDAQCLRHPWLARFRADGEEDVEMDLQHQGLSAIPEDADVQQELDASQLSLHDRLPAVVPDEDDLEYDEDDIEELHQSKRLKADVPRAMGFEPRNDSMLSQDLERTESMYSTMPMFINAGSQPVGYGAPRRAPAPAPAPALASNRLFGEIGTSMLASSGVFGHDAHAAPNMAVEGSRDESVALSADTSVDNTTESHVTDDGISEHSLQYPQLLPATTYAGPAPSLMGAEALVGQLNMASLESAISAPSTDSKSGTPRTPRSRELSPAAANVVGLKRFSRDAATTAQPKDEKRSKTGHMAKPVEHGGGRPPNMSATHSPAKASGIDASNAPVAVETIPPIEAPASHHESSKKPHKSRRRSHRDSSSKPTPDLAKAGQEASGPRRSHRSSAKSEHKDTTPNDDRVEPRTEGGKKGDASRSKTASTGEADVATVPAGNKDRGAKGSTPKEKEKKHRDRSSKVATAEGSKTNTKDAKGPAGSQDGSTSSSNTSSGSTVHRTSPPNDPAFVRPPPIFGKLTTLPHSIISTTIKLTDRLTYYGRDPSNSIVFPNNLEKRVPRHAFDIIFWRPSLERDIAKGVDWTKDESIRAIISTRTSRWILVNDIKVTKGADCWQYGKLYTGDIITIFDDPAEGHSGADFFKLECAFNVGVSKNKRPQNEPFVVEQEREKYQKTMGKKSRKQAKEDKKAESGSNATDASGSTEAPTPEPAAAPVSK